MLRDPPEQELVELTESAEDGAITSLDKQAANGEGEAGKQAADRRCLHFGIS